MRVGRLGGVCRRCGVALPGRILRRTVAARRFFLKRGKRLFRLKFPEGLIWAALSFCRVSFILADSSVCGILRGSGNSPGSRETASAGGLCCGKRKTAAVVVAAVRVRDWRYACGASVTLLYVSGCLGSRGRIRLCGFCGPALRFCRTVLPVVGAGWGAFCGILPWQGNFPLSPDGITGVVYGRQDDGGVTGVTKVCGGTAGSGGGLQYPFHGGGFVDFVCQAPAFFEAWEGFAAKGAIPAWLVLGGFGGVVPPVKGFGRDVAGA